ncbi:MAG: polysaccharide deacetylase family protein [Gammaproteobacteria bacterium]
MLITATKVALNLAALVQRRLSVVLFHHVLPTLDPLLPHEPDRTQFAAQVEWLCDAFNVLPAGEAAALLYAGKLPPRALCITFDDGYRDNVEHALPILQRYGVRATFFVTTRYGGGGMMWNDRVIAAIRAWPDEAMDLSVYGLGIIDLAQSRAAAVDALLPKIKYLPFAERERMSAALLEASGAGPSRLMMNEEEIATLHAAGMEIGGHTESHPILTSLPEADAQAEITRNKSVLESIIERPLTTFAYPNGQPGRDYDARHVAMLRESGYRYALTTAAGTANAATDPLQIPRFTPWARSPSKYLAQMLQNYTRRGATVATKTTGG